MAVTKAHVAKIHNHVVTHAIDKIVEDAVVNVRNQKNPEVTVVVLCVQKLKHASTTRFIHKVPIDAKLASPVFSVDHSPRVPSTT